jgi:hypothetical protein
MNFVFRRVSKTYPITLKFENDQGEAYRTIHLFPRTSREKEKWFKKLYEMIHFARGKKIPYSQTYDEYLKLVRILGSCVFEERTPSAFQLAANRCCIFFVEAYAPRLRRLRRSG